MRGRGAVLGEEAPMVAEEKLRGKMSYEEGYKCEGRLSKWRPQADSLRERSVGSRLGYVVVAVDYESGRATSRVRENDGSTKATGGYHLQGLLLHIYARFIDLPSTKSQREGQ